MTSTLIVTIGIFLCTLVVGFFKWLHGLVVSIKELAVKFDERSVTISNHLAKIDGTLRTLANADIRLNSLESNTNDHEGRLRNLESRRNYE